MHAFTFVMQIKCVCTLEGDRGKVGEHRNGKTIHQQLQVLSYAAWAVASHILSINNVHRSVPWRQGKEKIYCELNGGVCTVERERERNKMRERESLLV